MHKRSLPPKGQWLTTDGAARKLCVTPRTVRRFAAGGLLPFDGTFNGFWLFRPADVERLVVKRSRDATRSRAELLALVRPVMVAAQLRPQQSSFRVVPRKSERVCPRADTKGADVARKRA